MLDILIPHVSSLEGSSPPHFIYHLGWFSRCSFYVIEPLRDDYRRRKCTFSRRYTCRWGSHIRWTISFGFPVISLCKPGRAPAAFPKMGAFEGKSKGISGSLLAGSDLRLSLHAALECFRIAIVQGWKADRLQYSVKHSNYIIVFACGYTALH